MSQILRDIYELKYGKIKPLKLANLEQLATTLNNIGKPKSPWTIRLLFSLIKGYKGFVITDQLQKACEIYAAELDGQSYWQARAREEAIIVFNGTTAYHAWLDPHTNIPICARPECDIRFIKTNPAMKYCPRHRSK